MAEVTTRMPYTVSYSYVQQNLLCCVDHTHKLSSILQLIVDSSLTMTFTPLISEPHSVDNNAARLAWYISANFLKKYTNSCVHI